MLSVREMYFCRVREMRRVAVRVTVFWVSLRAAVSWAGASGKGDALPPDGAAPFGPSTTVSCAFAWTPEFSAGVSGSLLSFLML